MDVIGSTRRGIEPGRGDLRRTLQHILRRDGEKDLIRFLCDLLEEGRLELAHVNAAGARFWKIRKTVAAWDPEMDTDAECSLAALFLEGRLVFSIDLGPTLDVRWDLPKKVN